MRRSIRAAILAASLLLVVAAASSVAACGGSSAAAAQTQAAPSGMPQPGGQVGDPSTMLTRQLDGLVESGTITSAQQTAVVAALKAAMPGDSGGAGQGAPPSPGAQPSPGTQPPDRGAMLSTALAPLVEKGTITAAQQEAIQEALMQSMPGAPGGATAPPAAST